MLQLLKEIFLTKVIFPCMWIIDSTVPLNSVYNLKRIELFWGKNLYIECCSRKERSRIDGFLAGMWQMKGARRDVDKNICFLCLDEEDVKHILLDCKNTKHRRIK